MAIRSETNLSIMVDHSAIVRLRLLRFRNGRLSARLRAQHSTQRQGQLCPSGAIKVASSAEVSSMTNSLVLTGKEGSDS